MVNVSQQIEIATENFLAEQFETVSHKTEYPYGRHRGDERIQTVYQRKDGNTISDSDMEVILARDLDSQKYDMAALRGVYYSKLSEDRQTVTVKYTRVSCG